MGMTRVEYDRLVRKRKKCKVGGVCIGERLVAQGNPEPPTAQSPEPSMFPPRVTPFQPANNLARYAREMRDLTQQLSAIQRQYVSYKRDIDAGSTSGLGHYLNQGDVLLESFDQLYDRVELKQRMYKNLDLDDMKMLYNHFTAAYDLSNIPHPPNHPLDTNSVKSKTTLIEALTEDYGHDPLEVLDAYHNLSASPDSPGTLVGSPRGDDEVLLLKEES
eukprot:138867-Prymnesium_polylepis.3